MNKSNLEFQQNLNKHDCNDDDFESMSGTEIIFEYRLGNARESCIGEDDGFSITIYSNGDLLYKEYETINTEVKCDKFILPQDIIKQIYYIIKECSINDIPESLDNGSCDGSSNKFVFYDRKKVLAWNIIDEEYQPERLGKDYLREYGQNYLYECQVIKLFNEISIELLKIGYKLSLDSFS